MADVSKRLAMGFLLTETNGVADHIYTTPAGKRTFVKAITLCNMSSTPQTVKLKFSVTYIMFNFTIKGNDTLTIPFMDHILEPGDKITGTSPNAGVSYYISGREVDL